MKYNPKYLNNEGKFQKIYEALFNKYIPTEHDSALIDKKFSRLVGYSEREINKAIKAVNELIKFSRYYYSFYRDRKPFKWKGKTFKFKTLTESEMKILDNIFDKLVKEAWEATDKARMPQREEVVYTSYSLDE